MPPQPLPDDPLSTPQFDQSSDEDEDYRTNVNLARGSSSLPMLAAASDEDLSTPDLDGVDGEVDAPELLHAHRVRFRPRFPLPVSLSADPVVANTARPAAHWFRVSNVIPLTMLKAWTVEAIALQHAATATVTAVLDVLLAFLAAPAPVPTPVSSLAALCTVSSDVNMTRVTAAAWPTVTSLTDRARVLAWGGLRPWDTAPVPWTNFDPLADVSAEAAAPSFPASWLAHVTVWTTSETWLNAAVGGANSKEGTDDSVGVWSGVRGGRSASSSRVPSRTSSARTSPKQRPSVSTMGSNGMATFAANGPATASAPSVLLNLAPWLLHQAWWAWLTLDPTGARWASRWATARSFMAVGNATAATFAAELMVCLHDINAALLHYPLANRHPSAVRVLLNFLASSEPPAPPEQESDPLAEATLTPNNRRSSLSQALAQSSSQLAATEVPDSATPPPSWGPAYTSAYFRTILADPTDELIAEVEQSADTIHTILHHFCRHAPEEFSKMLIETCLFWGPYDAATVLDDLDEVISKALSADQQDMSAAEAVLSPPVVPAATAVIGTTGSRTSPAANTRRTNDDDNNDRHQEEEDAHGGSEQNDEEEEEEVDEEDEGELPAAFEPAPLDLFARGVLCLQLGRWTEVVESWAALGLETVEALLANNVALLLSWRWSPLLARLLRRYFPFSLLRVVVNLVTSHHPLVRRLSFFLFSECLNPV